MNIRLRSLSLMRLNKALDIAHLGCWEWALDDERFWYSESLSSILLIKDNQQLNLESFISGVHPADRSEVVKKLRKMRDDAQSMKLCFRVSALSGKCRHVQPRGCEPNIWNVPGYY